MDDVPSKYITVESINFMIIYANLFNPSFLDLVKACKSCLVFKKSMYFTQRFYSIFNYAVSRIPILLPYFAMKSMHKDVKIYRNRYGMKSSREEISVTSEKSLYVFIILRFCI